MALSDYAENKINDHKLGTTSWTMPTQIYVALYTTATTDAGGGTEVTGGSYARVAVDFNASANGSATPTADVVFPTATADWGTVTHVGFRDALTGGNLIDHGPLSASKVIQNGDTPQFTAAQLTSAMD